jgi:hypothetical protein
MIDVLQKDGYILFKKVLTPSEIEQGSSLISTKEVDYANMTDFITTVLLPRTSQQIGDDWNIVHAKYRVSNNNNSDAGAFHRDVVCMGPWIPALTCLTYFDTTVMELIPGSHHKIGEPYTEALSMFNKRVSLYIEPGDVLLFYATILHRGIFTTGQTQRRLVQVFDCFSDPVQYAKYYPQLIHITGEPSAHSSFLVVNKSPVLKDVNNFYGFLNAVTGYGSNKNLSFEGRQTFCSEGFCGRVTVVPNTMQPINQYILNTENNRGHYDLHPYYRSKWRWELYTKGLIIHVAITVFAIIIMLYIIYIIYSQIKLQLRNQK